MSRKNVGIAAMGHGPVEIIFRGMRENVEPIPLNGNDFVIQENVALVSKSMLWQVGWFKVVGMKDDGVTLVDKTLVRGGHAVSVSTASGNKRLST